MKRLRSSDDLHSYGGEKNSNGCKDSSNLNRSFSSAQRSFYYKPDNARKGLVSSSSSRYERDRAVEEDREGSRVVRKRSEHDFEGFDRRKGFDRYRESDRSLMHRSESFCSGGSRRDQFPKGFRSERDRSRREGSVSSWRRGLKDLDERERVVRSPKGLRDVKSPSWSKDSVSESEQSKKRSSSPRPFREGNSNKSKSKSPTWSKDSVSESEQSKSVEVKKAEEELLQQVQSGSSSEMEEGELEPEPQTEMVAPASEDLPPSVTLETDERHVQKNERHPNDDDTDALMDERQELSTKEEVKPNEEVGFEVKDAEKEADEMPDVQEDPTEKMAVTETELGSVGNGDDDKREQCLDVGAGCEEETKKSGDVEKEKLVLNEDESKEDKGVDLGTSTDIVKPELNDGLSTENEVPKEVDREVTMEGVANNVKDKGKGISVALAPPTDVAHSSDDGLWMERGSMDLPTCSVDVIEGPSTRGFELFSRSPVRKVEKVDHSVLNKHKDDLEQLDLTLSLPNVLLPIGAHETGAHETTSQGPGSPSQARSVQSLSNTFCTNSDGFPASMSLSGSQSFYHNPSCSLTKNSVDYEQSVGSRPLFQGIDQVSQGCWQGQSQSDSKQKEVPFGQRTSVSGNGSLFQSQASWGVLDSQALKGQHSRVLEGSSKVAGGLDRQLSFHKQFSGQSRRHDDVRSPPQSVGSHDIGSNYSFEKKREARDRSSGSLYRTTSQKEQEQLMMGGADFVETIIARIVSEPVHAMSRKFHEMTGQSIACLKEGIREIMLNADKHGQILAFQKVLQNRSDVILDVLLKCHRVQLEILVALKTGLTHFLHLDNSISSSELAQIFLNSRCKNLSCRSQLPVDECDCKVCAQKNGFCRECMCLVCSKFDNASNTCSWVGCDVCLHWCHTDCGLRESYIRNGHGTKGMAEMQFHCIACDHPSEMFGFVKEVFHNFAKEWSVEALCRELEYVKRIFSASKDMRGRQLYEIAEQMLPRLANKSNLPEVLRHIMSFLSDGDSSKLAMTANFAGKEQIKENNGVAGPSQEAAAWMKSIYSEKPPLLERPVNILPTFDQNDKRTLAQELQMSSIQKDYCFDELESVVKIKQAEAKMFQSRADDARREAEGLKRIALAKNEKIEEEYANRIAKLRLAETDEIRKQKFEEAQALERAHLEYLNMKRRMETDIKDLLSKMEATKMSLAM
ncbi:protein OBERON 4 [Vigna unguiculata]|uniref:Oberon n=1 Tax=Vigna unguiculata TaxID=3917 RepID=A0A4D6LKY2_VIGUN|nr:protein OBERON 4 [Vigna unguiculata]QCD88956.1 Oberon [Vigna unguiculata]